MGYLKRNSQVWLGVGARIACAVWAADGWFTFDGRPSIEFPYVGRYAPSEREP